MNYVFFGTPRFAEIVFQKLIEGGMPPSLVVTNPDRPVGRKQIITPSPVKALAGRYAIPLLQPEDIKNFVPTGHLPEGDKLHFAILASYGKIIPKEIIGLFPRGIVVVHPSLLPKYRGATPIQSALLAGDEETGVSLIRMDEKVDHGPIIAERELNKELGIMSYESLHDALAKLSGELLLETIPEYLAGTITPREQNHAEATFTRKFSADDAFVGEEELHKAETAGGETAVTIDRMIRALNPEPGVWTLRGGKRIKLLEAELVEGKLKLKKIQEEGKTPRAV